MMYYTCNENKGADQLRGYCEADLRLCFRLCRLLVLSCGGSYSIRVSILIIGTFRSIGNRVYSAAHVQV